MAVDKSRKPYFDDYDEKKGFHEVLFQPRYAVQVRELNQIQSMFYKQIERLGNHLFQEGSVVIPGETSYDLDYSYVAVDIANFTSIKNQLVNSGNILTGELSGVKAEVVQFFAADDYDPSTFYLKYLSSGNGGMERVFQRNETLKVTNSLGNQITTAIVRSTGTGSKFTVNEGVYYIGGRFVLTDRQTITLDKYGVKPSYTVGFLAKETVVNSTQDNTLFDNALGSPNFRAPGANRLHIDLQLVKFPLTQIEYVPADFVEIFRIENGQVQKKARGPEYNILNDTLARRTYDQSGDYTVNPFSIQIKEHLNDGHNNGVYNKVDGGDENKYIVAVNPGKAYVRGYEIENPSTKYLSVEKARDTEINNNSSISAVLGYYIDVVDVENLPDTNNFQTINFLNQDNNKLGTARVSFVQKNGDKYQLYLFDVKNAQGSPNTSFIADTRHLTSDYGIAFRANVRKEDAQLRGTSANSYIYQLPAHFIKSLLDKNGVSDTSFMTVRQFNTVVSTDGNVVLSSVSNEVFLNQDSRYAFASFTDTHNQLIDVSNKYSLGGNGKNITVQIGKEHAGKTIRINLQVAKNVAVQKTKALTNLDINGTPDSSGVLSLKKADVFKIDSIVDKDNKDITEGFDLVENKRSTYYDISYIKSNGKSSFTSPITVRYKYFQHGIGDFFSVDSYSGINYADIPVEGDIHLSDVLDFRPRLDDEGKDFVGPGSNTGNLPSPYSVIRADIEFYLPRNDKVFLKSNGEFGIAKGVPSLEPNDPPDPVDSLALYVIRIPAYTPRLEDIRSVKVSTRRYTMNDIAKIDKRLSNVEQYVALSALEKDAKDIQVIDDKTGITRFKNGFQVDGFVDHSVGDYGWDGYHCSIGQGELRPEFSLNSVNLEFNESKSTNVVNNNGILTLPFREVDYIGQPSRSESMNINPYPVFRWSGSIKLFPSFDSWFDTIHSVPDVTYREFNNGNIFQNWKSWQLNWASMALNANSRDFVKDEPHGRYISIDENSVTGATIDQFNGSNTMTNFDMVNDRLISTNITPHMRPLDIAVSGYGHKPNTKLHFFFDGINVDRYMKSGSNDFNNEIITDAEGNFKAIFKIPNDEKLKFTTGIKPLSVTDDEQNRKEYALTYADEQFTVSGSKELRQQTVVSTRNTSSYSTNNWVSPVAQSFLIDQKGGAFVTKLELFFKSKDNISPVSVDIREMENGNPTQRIVPGTKVTLTPSRVKTSDNGNIATEFVFDYPVYLQESVEYCFVVSANSSEYNIFIATMGDKDLISGKYISKQPYVGVMFKSQNNNFWSKDQNSDIHFQLHKAKFKTNLPSTVSLVNKEICPMLIGSNKIKSNKDSNLIEVHLDKHNFIVGSKLKISNCNAGNGISPETINAIHTVVESDNVNYFVIKVGSNADTTGFFGGEHVTISNVIQASALNLSIGDINLPNTSIVYTATGTRGKSKDGNEVPYQTVGYAAQLQNNELFELDEPWIITNEFDEDQNFNRNKTLNVTAEFKSTNENISPVIDIQRSQLIAPYYMINKKGYANYRTRISNLPEAANALRIFTEIKCPQESTFVVSARFGNSKEEVESATWKQMRLENGSVNSTSFIENEYDLDAKNGEIHDYTYFQVMLTMNSNSNAKVPVCRKLRIISLGT